MSGEKNRGNTKASLVAPACLIFLGIAIFLAAQAKSHDSEKDLASGHSVTLNWQATQGARFYCIYRSTVSKSGYTKIGTSPTPHFKDAPVPSGATFYYVVTAVGDKGESKYSSEIKAVVPK